MPGAMISAASVARITAIGGMSLGRDAREPTLDNICYSLAGPHWGFVEINRYQPDKGLLTAVPGAAKTSPLKALPAMRSAEADEDEQWFATLTRETFG